MPFNVGVPLTAGAETAAPLPLATALAVTVPDGVILAAAPVTCEDGMLAGKEIFTGFALYVVGVPVMATVTTVLPVRVTVPRDNPAGKFMLLT